MDRPRIPGGGYTPPDVEGRNRHLTEAERRRVAARKSRGGAAPSAGVVVMPPSIYKPPAAKDVNRFGSVSGLTSAASPSEPASLAFDIPANNVGVIRSLTLDVSGLLTTSDIRWDLLENGGPMPGWADLTVFPRNASSVSLTWSAEETFISLVEGASVSVRLRVLDGGTYDVGASWHGWYYPVDLAARYAGAWS